jgi:hypothetical protein
MGRYVMMGVAGLALAAAAWVFGSGSLGGKPAGVSEETTASIPSAATRVIAPADGGDGHAVAGDWVQPTTPHR